jgi:hypothetical protein
LAPEPGKRGLEVQDPATGPESPAVSVSLNFQDGPEQQLPTDYNQKSFLGVVKFGGILGIGRQDGWQHIFNKPGRFANQVDFFGKGLKTLLIQG